MPRWEFCVLLQTSRPVDAGGRGKKPVWAHRVVGFTVNGGMTVLAERTWEEGSGVGVFESMAAQLGLEGWEPFSTGGAWYFKRQLPDA